MTLLLKLLLAPLLVVVSTLAGRRWGAQVAGVLVALPIVAGPILLIAGLEHGARFGAGAAASALLGLVSLALFVVAFGQACRWLAWPAALAVSWAVCLAADAGLALVRAPAIVAFAVVLGAAWLAARLLPGPQTPAREAPRNQGSTAPWWDLPARAVATAGLVLTVTGVAERVGPAVTGVLAPFPIATSVVAAFTLARDGRAAALRMLGGVPRGLSGFAVFCLVVAAGAERVGVAAAFAAATGAALGVQLWSLRPVSSGATGRATAEPGR